MLKKLNSFKSEPDTKASEKADPDQKEIIPDLQHCQKLGLLYLFLCAAQKNSC